MRLACFVALAVRARPLDAGPPLVAPQASLSPEPKSSEIITIVPGHVCANYLHVKVDLREPPEGPLGGVLIQPIPPADGQNLQRPLAQSKPEPAEPWRVLSVLMPLVCSQIAAEYIREIERERDGQEIAAESSLAGNVERSQLIINEHSIGRPWARESNSAASKLA